MTRVVRTCVAAFAGVSLLAVADVATAQATTGLPSPLGLADVVRIAGERRAEVVAARARVRAGEARPAIVSALDDPMISPSIDHLPFMLGGADVSVTIEQRLPLSGVREHRRAAALADLDRLRADRGRATLDVGAEAAAAFLMLNERRRMALLLGEQITFARDVVAAADARYASGAAPQSDVLRAELEVARLEARSRALAGDVTTAEAMLNTSLGLPADGPVPPLAAPAFGDPLPTAYAVQRALGVRPELEAGKAEIARADAEVQVMRDMFRPMATIRTGPSYTMAEGNGWMGMVGLSVPIWKGKLRAGVAEAQAMRAMAAADLDAMTRMVEGDTAAAATQVRSARDTRQALVDDVMPRARMAIEPAVAGYASGQLPLVSVIEAVQTLWAIQADLIAADTTLGLAWARLGRALGSYEAISR